MAAICRSNGCPAIKPPWGTFNVIDLKTERLSMVGSIGDFPNWLPRVLQTGTETYGGPVVTASGLIFMASAGLDDSGL
ncbi:MAG: hypothetical protein IPG82_17695 [Saprospiraceae bacterium]|nr:hypothetical protein [Saprospiraceae bacterium]